MRWVDLQPPKIIDDYKSMTFPRLLPGGSETSEVSFALIKVNFRLLKRTNMRSLFKIEEHHCYWNESSLPPVTLSSTKILQLEWNERNKRLYTSCCGILHKIPSLESFDDWSNSNLRRMIRSLLSLSCLVQVSHTSRSKQSFPPTFRRNIHARKHPALSGKCLNGILSFPLLPPAYFFGRSDPVMENKM